MVKAFINKDYNTLLRYTHPNIIKIAGGKTKIIQLISKELSTIENDGFKFTKVVVDKPLQVIKSEKNYQAILPQTIVLTKFNNNAGSTSHLWAISYNQGKTWFFSDANTRPRKQLEALFPEMDKKLNIPPKTNNY